jgi:hypothetical protein
MGVSGDASYNPATRRPIPDFSALSSGEMAESRLIRPPQRHAWTPAESADAPADQRPVAAGVPGLRFTIARFSDNELVLFDTAAQESWIIYPPRSRYAFLRARRASSRVTVVEYHPWAPFSKIEDHPLRPENACGLHGMSCAAHEVIQAAVQLGFDPFR